MSTLRRVPAVNFQARFALSSCDAILHARRREGGLKKKNKKYKNPVAPPLPPLSARRAVKRDGAPLPAPRGGAGPGPGRLLPALEGGEASLPARSPPAEAERGPAGPGWRSTGGGGGGGTGRCL